MKRIITFFILTGFLLIISKPFQKVGVSLVKNQSTSFLKYTSADKNSSFANEDENLVLEEDLNEKSEEDAVSNHSVVTIDYFFYQLTTSSFGSETMNKLFQSNAVNYKTVSIYSLKVLRI